MASYAMPTFSTLQRDQVARPPSPEYQYPQPQPQAMPTSTAQQPQMAPPTTRHLPQPGTPQTAPPLTTMAPAPPGSTVTSTTSMLPPPSGGQPGGQPGGQQPSLEQMWRQMFGGGGSVPGFQAPGGVGQVNDATRDAVLAMLGNPSRYGSEQAQQTFDVLNRRITQAGEADRQRIDEDMARRGLFASTVAGGRLGDLATNLNQQRADVATQIALDQARQYQGDRMSAIGGALGLSGQEFGQGLQGYGANLGANQQSFAQRLAALQGLTGVGQQAFENQLSSAQFNNQQQQQYLNFLLAMMGMGG